MFRDAHRRSAAGTPGSRDSRMFLLLVVVGLALLVGGVALVLQPPGSRSGSVAAAEPAATAALPPPTARPVQAQPTAQLDPTTAPLAQPEPTLEAPATAAVPPTAQPSTSQPAAPDEADEADGLLVAEDGLVRVPATDLADGTARFYTYAGVAKNIRFFVLQGSDGKVRAAYDACDVCFEARKGYRQEGDVMVCNNCGSRFPSVKINTVRGGCNPAPLDGRVDGDFVVFDATDVQAGARYF